MSNEGQLATDVDVRTMLMQARYVLRDMHARDNSCGYAKLAEACETAANMLEDALNALDAQLKFCSNGTTHTLVVALYQELGKIVP